MNHAYIYKQQNFIHYQQTKCVKSLAPNRWG